MAAKLPKGHAFPQELDGDDASLEGGSGQNERASSTNGLDAQHCHASPMNSTVEIANVLGCDELAAVDCPGGAFLGSGPRPSDALASDVSDDALHITGSLRRSEDPHFRRHR
jgi:hypothetical protein